MSDKYLELINSLFGKNVASRLICRAVLSSGHADLVLIRFRTGVSHSPLAAAWTGARSRCHGWPEATPHSRVLPSQPYEAMTSPRRLNSTCVTVLPCPSSGRQDASLPGDQR